jgi:hypothetical protein
MLQALLCARGLLLVRSVGRILPAPTCPDAYIHPALVLCCSYPEESHHIATPAGTSFAYCGSVAAADYPSLLAIMHVIIAKEQKAKKEEKPKGIGRSSNFQRTPAFVAVCVKAAAEVVALQQQRNESPNDAEAAAADISLQEPAGGFTDVGLHTAGIRRDTAWPVVWHMIQVCGLSVCVPHVLGCVTEARACSSHVLCVG